MAAQNEAAIWGVMAASGSGKGVWLKAQLRKLKPARLIVWDHKDEYQEAAPGPLVSSIEQVRRAMLAAGARGPLRLRYRCKFGTADKQRMAEFQALCALVQAWGRCMFVVEELSNVTTPSWAPPAWREMTTGGRHEGIFIVGIAQNPALIDKTFLSNCTMVHVGPLREFRHRQTVARSIDCPPEKIAALVQFHYVERDYTTGELREGAKFPPGVTPTRSTPTPTPRGGASPSQKKPARG